MEKEAAPKELPEGWIIAFDYSGGRVFYYQIEDEVRGYVTENSDGVYQAFIYAPESFPGSATKLQGVLNQAEAFAAVAEQSEKLWLGYQQGPRIKLAERITERNPEPPRSHLRRYEDGPAEAGQE